MAEIGQCSHTEEVAECRDIPVVSERLVGYTPVAPTQPESEEDEGFRVESSEPVWGRVMRFGGDDDGEDDEVEATAEESVEETDEAIEADPEEGPEEMAVEPAGYHDAMGTTSDDIFEELTTHTVQLEERVAHLEEQNALHQEMEEQYKAEAYQRQSEVMELKAHIHTLEGAASQTGPTVQQLMLQNSQLRQALEHSQARGVELQTALQSVRAERDWERADGERLQGFWARAATRVDMLQREVRDRCARIDTLEHDVETAFHRLRDRIWEYPREEGSSRRMIRRRVVDRMARQAFRRAIRHRGH